MDQYPARKSGLIAGLRQRWHNAAHPFFLLAIAACAGIGVADALPRVSAWVWLAACAVSAGAVRWFPRPTVLLLAASVFGFAHHANDRDPLREQLAANLRPGGAVPVTVTGMVADAPEPGMSGNSFTFPLQTGNLETQVAPEGSAGCLLYVRIRDFPRRLKYGDRITLTGMLGRPAPPANPGEFDFPAYLRRQGFSASLEAVGTHDQLTVLARDQGAPVMKAALESRDWIGYTVTRDITDDADLSATVRAMVLGTREKTPAEIEDAFVASGTMHVFAVSGLHVAMFCAVLWGVLKLFRLPHAWVVLLALPLVFFYVFITGLRPSAWRAAIMAAILMSGPLFNRESNLFNSLGAAALLLLGEDTQQLFQPGFTLSFGVLLALALLQPFSRWLLKPLAEPDAFIPLQLYSKHYPVRLWLRKLVAGSLSVSIASTIGSAWLMIHYFSIITPIGIVANLFLVSLSLGILVLACASIATAAAGLTLVSICLNNCNWLMASASVRTAQFFASIPGGHLQFDPARLWRGTPCEITVLHLDTGGGCSHIDTPEGNHWLIDAGGQRHFQRTVRPHLARTPVNSLDGLLLSHGDAHHTGAAEEVRRVFRPDMEPVLYAGQSLQQGEEVSVRCLFPPRGWKSRRQDDACAVYMLECRGTRVLFMNDAGFNTEKALLESGEDLRADIVVKGRHRLDFSGLPEFVNAVRPQVVIFSHSSFPSSEAVPPAWRKMLEAKGIRCFDQSLTGAAVIRIEEDATWVRGWLDGSEIRLTPGSVSPP